MTKEQFYQRFSELKELADKEINKRAAHLLDSGAIDLAGEQNNYLCPKIVLASCLEHIASSFRLTLSSASEEELANLRKF